MPQKEAKTTPKILYSCYSNISREGEQFIGDHILGYIISGSTDLYVGGKSYVFNEGDFRFLRKNQLAKFSKHPPKGGEFKTISIVMDKETLGSLSEELALQTPQPYTGDSAMMLQPAPLLKNYIDSLAPYMDGSGNDNKMLTTLKVKEAIMILLQTNPALKNTLFDFSEPGKIDLEAYMNEHYKFNVDIRRFAYLTGRSLATFKRDFEKIFHTSPNRWLQQKRLNDAYFLIKEKGWKTSDVFMEVGFKDFSHFSFAFKKAYGIAPSRLI
ncbi:AraC family transcriptional regulator [Mucilaginibacter xinganensis]|uniref:AraC family transcriptional regulator n=1 Tax=Mucilaginibacter xinganensis TaxID=1234841 RepID=A0A223NQA7_9SPHI|nr:AraC family transcriptional regulator [Mucilaginibacter xinganensis]ASU31986.1 AraC family transcriptional regulator [Mucilaginibacter xinganensis]